MRQTKHDIKQYFSSNCLANYWNDFKDKLKPCISIKHQLSKDDEVAFSPHKVLFSDTISDLERKNDLLIGKTMK